MHDPVVDGAPLRLDASDGEELQRRAAGSLADASLVAGDRLAIVAPPSTLVVVAALAALRSGIVPVMVNPALLPAERAVIEGDADATVTLDGTAAVAGLVRGRPVPLAPAPRCRPMHYTSGTTGRPKGVWSGVFDEDAGEAWVAEETDLWGFAADDVHLVCGPLHHSAPLRFAALTLLGGGDIVVPGAFRADVFARAVVEQRVTTTFVVPAHLQRLLAPGDPGDPGGLDAPGREALDSASLRLVAHAGAPCPEPLKRLAIEAFGIDVLVEFYGATEGQFTSCGVEEWLARPGTVGRARPGRVLSVDPDATLWCTVPPHARFSYWGDPAATAAAWRGDAFTVGDAGRLDADGYLFLDGRRGDIIITGGVNVAPLEVEAALARCPGVTDVVVFGVDDERWGQRVCAAVVGSASPEEVQAHARTTLSAYKRPKQVLVVDAVPRTVTGKVRRHTVAADLGVDST